MNTPAHGGAPTVIPGLFQCGWCKRHYKRVDHLARHVRSHTQAKPYKCQVCPKAFSRPDLLKRHAAGHDSPDSRSKQATGTSPGQIPEAPARVSQACQSCAANHLRCSESKPCSRCTGRGMTCVWDKVLDDMDITPSAEQEPISATDGNAGTPQASRLHLQHDNSEGTPDEHTRESMITVQPSPAQDPFGESTMADQVFPRFPDIDLLTGQWTPMVALDFDMALNTELDDMDLRFLDTYNTHIPFEFGIEPALGPLLGSSENTSSNSTDPCRPAAMCTEAFRNSHWRFRPSVNDHAGAEDHNLSLPSAPIDHASPESRISLDRRVTCAKLGVAARDRILAMVVESCRPENLSRAIASFPSVELLETLFQYYLTSPIARADSYIHSATFDPNEKRPELLAAMAAAGAILTSDLTLTKLGYAIQECVRLAVPKHWERDNTLVRDLELLQSFLITLEMGIWSGRSRQVEIAESFLQPVLTMLRRDARLRRSGYPKTVICGDESSHELRGLWKTWVHHESFKRLTFRVFQHDTNTSMALLVNPLISYAEVQLLLPDSDDMWSASSVEHWKVAYLFAQNSPKALTVADIMDNPEVLHCHGNVVDAVMTAQAFLSCSWSLTWDMNTYIPSEEDVVMRLELVLLHLHMPFEDLQVFAGMEGPDQARVVYPAILAWARSESARKSMWHAGQIIRAAKGLPRTTLQGPAAIMVYHASLALWVYGLLALDDVRTNSGAGNSLQHTQQVMLDGSESLAAQRFIQIGTGRPCIRGVQGCPPDAPHVEMFLSEPDKVMGAVADILRANHVGPTRPHLVEKLIQLMNGLQSSAMRTGEV
ncbi:fungal-specific transcription factor domain-containing protein [Coniochaeta sp. 2T2.1]|nr:fungal-specific transcription factor domain-containing protein [Coniochaeta sp. 2T2.1]